MSNTKVCEQCGMTRPVIEFHVAKHAVDGHTKQCKVCIARHKKELGEIRTQMADEWTHFRRFYGPVDAREILKRIYRLNNPDFLSVVRPYINAEDYQSLLDANDNLRHGLRKDFYGA